MTKKCSILILILLLSTSLFSNLSIQKEAVCDRVDKILSSYSNDEEKHLNELKLCVNDFAKLKYWDCWYNTIRKFWGKISNQDFLEILEEFEPQAENSDLYPKSKFYYLKAYLFDKVGNIEQALQNQEKAYYYLQESKVDDYAAYNSLLKNLSTYYSRFNDHEASIIYTKKRLSKLDPTDTLKRYETFSNLVTYHSLLGEFKKSQVYLDSMRLFERKVSASTLLIDCGLSLGLNDFKRAREIMFQLESGNLEINKSQAVDILKIKAKYSEAIGNLKNASSYWEQVLQLGETIYISRDHTKNIFSYAGCLEKQGRYKEALTYCHQVLVDLCESFEVQDFYSLPEEKQITPEAYVMEALFSKARLFAKLKAETKDSPISNSQINEAFSKAIYCNEILRSKYETDRSKFEMTELTSAIFDEAIQFNIDQYKLKNENAYLEKAFAYAQLKKAFVFKSSKSTRSILNSLDLDQAEIDNYFKLKTVDQMKKISYQMLIFYYKTLVKVECFIEFIDQ